jgi:NAD(P)-dependent dehydrogenase (short-subunit alcohol dehydrogenase family)
LSSGVAVDEIDGVGPLHHLGDVRKRPHECFDLRKRDNEIRLVVCGPAPGAPQQRSSGRHPSSPPSAAAAPAFLANEDASYVSGAAIVVDGALSAVTGQPNFDRLIGGE